MPQKAANHDLIDNAQFVLKFKGSFYLIISSITALFGWVAYDLGIYRTGQLSIPGIIALILCAFLVFTLCFILPAQKIVLTMEGITLHSPIGIGYMKLGVIERFLAWEDITSISEFENLPDVSKQYDHIVFRGQNKEKVERIAIGPYHTHHIEAIQFALTEIPKSNPSMYSLIKELKIMQE